MDRETERRLEQGENGEEREGRTDRQTETGRKGERETERRGVGDRQTETGRKGERETERRGKEGDRQRQREGGRDLFVHQPHSFRVCTEYPIKKEKKESEFA